MNTNTQTSGRTNLESIKLLCQSVVRRLESQKMIAADRMKRNELIDDMAEKMSAHILTQEDMEKNVLESIGEKNEKLDELRLSGGEAYRTLRQSWLSRFGENEVDGLYFQQPIKYIADHIIEYLMKSDYIEEVFEDDVVLGRTIVATIGSFRRSRLH